MRQVPPQRRDNVMNDKEVSAHKVKPDEQQSDATTEANKPEKARAKGAPKAGNILGGVQPDTN